MRVSWSDTTLIFENIPFPQERKREKDVVKEKIKEEGTRVSFDFVLVNISPMRSTSTSLLSLLTRGIIQT